MHENGKPYNVITEGAEGTVEVKKSVFIAELANVKSEDEAKAFLAEVKKEHRDARHHCYAFRIGEPGTESERCSDDGEPQGTAGKPILTLLKGNDLYDICAVVTRYFGGTLLGTGGLSRAYSDACREAVQNASLHELFKGSRVRVTTEYQLLERIRYVSSMMGIFTEKEEYGEKCVLSFLVRDPGADDFARKIRELSSGRALTEITETLYFYEDSTPSVYKKL